MKSSNGNCGLYGRAVKKSVGGRISKRMGLAPRPDLGRIMRGRLEDHGSPKGVLPGEFRDLPRIPSPGRNIPVPRVPNDPSYDTSGTTKPRPDRNIPTPRVPPRSPGRGNRGRKQLRGTRASSNTLPVPRGGPRLPGGERLRPPEMGPNPDAGQMGPRRLEGMGASIIDALGLNEQSNRVKSAVSRSRKMNKRGRNRPPIPRGRRR
tara:strand:+ start:870 stop:1487 length:618 start_codon:yes stop_codon:yes gene_type:complete